MKKRGQKKPGYYLEGHMLPCVRNLRPMFGSHDAAIQANQIVLTYFENENRDAVNTKLLELAEEFKISPGNSDFLFVKKAIAEMYLTSTYTLVDRSLKDFAADCIRYKQIEWKHQNGDGDNLDPLSQILYNLSAKQRSQIKQYPEYWLIDYYRHIRNHIIHPNPQNLSRLAKKHQELLDLYEFHWLNVYKITPNNYEGISYEDYFIYTRAFKYFVNVLSNTVGLTTDEIVVAAKNNAALQKRLRSCEQISNHAIRIQRITALRSFYRAFFSYGTSRQLENSFIDEYAKVDRVSWN